MIYGKIINGQFVKAPTCINNDFNLTEEKYLSAGYLPVIEEDPTPPKGMELSYSISFMQVFGEIENEGTAIVSLLRISEFEQ